MSTTRVFAYNSKTKDGSKLLLLPLTVSLINRSTKYKWFFVSLVVEVCLL